MNIAKTRFAAGGVITAAALLIFHGYGTAAGKTEVAFPAVNDTSALEARKQAQMKTVSEFKVFYEFQFADRLRESGITFINHIVDDAAKSYQKAHYDHGTGVAVADVDGDGLYDIYFVSQVGGNQLWKNLGGHRLTRCKIMGRRKRRYSFTYLTSWSTAAGT